MNRIHCQQFRVRRMHKVMHVLDQVYFSPVLQRKFKALARLKRRSHKVGKVSTKRHSGGAAHGSTTAMKTGPSNNQITTKPNKDLTVSESSESLTSQSSNSLTDNESKQVIKAPHPRKRKQKKKVMQIEKGKPKVLSRKTRIDRNLRLWLANRRIFIFRCKKVSIGTSTRLHP